jgi:hypothetical protein
MRANFKEWAKATFQLIAKLAFNCLQLQLED